jgi:hypothetical protein
MMVDVADGMAGAVSSSDIGTGNAAAEIYLMRAGTLKCFFCSRFLGKETKGKRNKGK